MNIKTLFTPFIWSLLLLANAQLLAANDNREAPKATPYSPPSATLSSADQKSGTEQSESAKIEHQKKDENNKAGSERFTPSEEVSKDLSVSFPVDI